MNNYNNLNNQNKLTDRDISKDLLSGNSVDLNLDINKKVYGLKKFRENTDYQFTEFLPKNIDIKTFFNYYENHFYNINNDLHITFLDKSKKYAYPEGWTNPRLLEINNLNTQITETQDAIDEIERIHPFIRNSKFLMSTIYKDNPTAAIEEGKVYYMQSAKKRQILTSTAYYNLKNKIRKRLGPIEDKLFLIFISNEGLEGIPTGPVIEKSSDTYISTLELNRYNHTS